MLKSSILLPPSLDVHPLLARFQYPPSNPQEATLRGVRPQRKAPRALRTPPLASRHPARAQGMGGRRHWRGHRRPRFMTLCSTHLAATLQAAVCARGQRSSWLRERLIISLFCDGQVSAERPTLSNLRQSLKIALRMPFLLACTALMFQYTDPSQRQLEENFTQKAK